MFSENENEKKINSLRQELARREKMEILMQEKSKYEKKLKEISELISQLKKGHDVKIVKGESSETPEKAKKKAKTESKTPSKPKLSLKYADYKKITVALMKKILKKNDVEFKKSAKKSELVNLIVKKRLKTQLLNAAK
jgi:hypothetical protein